MAVLGTLPFKEANHAKGYRDPLITPNAFIVHHLTHVRKLWFPKMWFPKTRTYWA
jgi:hypothetical protein